MRQTFGMMNYTRSVRDAAFGKRHEYETLAHLARITARKTQKGKARAEAYLERIPARGPRP